MELSLFRLKAGFVFGYVFLDFYRSRVKSHSFLFCFLGEVFNFKYKDIKGLVE